MDTSLDLVTGNCYNFIKREISVLEKIIDGKSIANSRETILKSRCDVIKQKGIEPKLAVILVGNDSASEIYVRFKQKAAKKIGIKSELIRLPDRSDINSIYKQINFLNKDTSVHGILLQLPLPRNINKEETENLIQSILPEKDVDGLHPQNLGLIGTSKGFIACTPLGCLRLLGSTKNKIIGSRALVVGRSRIVGRPMASLLTSVNATVTVAHSKSLKLDERVRESDILIAAAGSPLLIKGEWIKEGATVIDVGIHRTDSGKLIGDVDFQSAYHRASAITPVPGGVGPMTISSLMENVCLAAERRLF
tara:strand:+ start:395 stop:1315 length:921 start_codon:yes stop_codon:yes gene_type:complete